jgi:small subunit ribosomal protein S7
MSRTRKVIKKEFTPDPVYGNRLVTRFINRTMTSGKKTVAEKLVYNTFDRIKSKGRDPIEVFETAIANVSPKIEVRPRRVGGASYQVPVEVRGERREALAIRWILNAAKARPSREYHTFVDKLFAELTDAASGSGAAVKKREDIHRMAEANKAFAHFRW